MVAPTPAPSSGAKGAGGAQPPTWEEVWRRAWHFSEDERLWIQSVLEPPRRIDANLDAVEVMEALNDAIVGRRPHHLRRFSGGRAVLIVYYEDSVIVLRLAPDEVAGFRAWVR